MLKITGIFYRLLISLKDNSIGFRPIYSGNRPRFYLIENYTLICFSVELMGEFRAQCLYGQAYLFSAFLSCQPLGFRPGEVTDNRSDIFWLLLRITVSITRFSGVVSEI